MRALMAGMLLCFFFLAGCKESKPSEHLPYPPCTLSSEQPMSTAGGQMRIHPIEQKTVICFLNTAAVERRIRIVVQNCKPDSGSARSAQFMSMPLSLAPNQSLGYKIPIAPGSLPEGVYTCEIIAEDTSAPGSPALETMSAQLLVEA
jgi:hypothetical protein